MELARARVDMPFAAPNIMTNGASVGIAGTNGSWTSAAPCVAKTAAATQRGPNQVATGTKKRRPGSCIAPIQPIIIAAVVAA